MVIARGCMALEVDDIDGSLEVVVALEEVDDVDGSIEAVVALEEVDDDDDGCRSRFI